VPAPDAPEARAEDREARSRSSTPWPLPRWFVVLAVVIAIAVAGYTGFRVPSSWCTTHDSVSIFDGFYRRFVVGTVLRPLAVATDYNYWVFTAYNYLVLAVVLVVLTVAAAREALLSRRILIVAWLLLPTGGFLFNEVGYFDQVLYLLLFAALALLSRGRLIAATCVMCVTPFVHEIAIVTVIPAFGVVALRTLTPARALAVTVPPVLLNLGSLTLPAASSGAIARLTATLEHANFPFRDDALSLFQRTLVQNWGTYNLDAVYVYVRWFAVVLVIAFIAIWLTDRRLWCHRPDRTPTSSATPPATPPVRAMPALILAASCVAIAAPAVLVFGGLDRERWAFLMISNFMLLLWFSLGDRRRAELGAAAIVVLVTALLIINHFSLAYFDKYAPRDLGSRAHRRELVHKIFDRSLFTIPTW
jgi:hypothetical protein